MVNALCCWRRCKLRDAFRVVVGIASGASLPNAQVSLFLHDSNSAILVARTTSDGIFNIGTIRPDLYDLTVEAANFATAKVVNVKIDAVAETSLPAITLQIAKSSQSVNVIESVIGVDTSTTEINETIAKSQIDDLPALDRQISTLFQTQTGVTLARGFTVINGMRTTSSNVTYDGVNIQFATIRQGVLDSIGLPNDTTLDQVQEVTMSTSNPNSSLGNGASQVVLVTPSGTNSFHGSLYWYNRNADFAATDWFANQAGAGKAPLNLNQFGGTVGGPIKKDKLLFYGNYEGFRNVTSSPLDMLVLTAPARQGVLTYKNTAGGTQTLNVLQASGLSADPTMAGLLSQIPLPNNNNIGDGLNTAGYEINRPLNENRKTFSGKLDYYLSPKNVFSGSFNYNTDNVLEPGSLNGYFGGPVPVQGESTGSLLSASWRWTPTARLTNELRGGFNINDHANTVTVPQPSSYLEATFISLPGVNWGGLPSGQDSKVFSLQDNATYVRGKHTFSFGVQSYVLHQYLYAPGPTLGYSAIPGYALGLSSAAPFSFSTNNIPGAQSTYATTANNLLATLAGVVGSYSQQYNVTSQTSGFVPNAQSIHNYVYNTYSGYLADSYKVARHLTLNAGLRYDYWTPVYDSQGLFFEPVLENNNPLQTILDPNAVLNFIGNPGHPFYGASKKDFSPNAGFAWDIFGDGKTSLRGGYSLSFFNDDAVISAITAAGANNGISATVANNNAYALLRNGLPAIQTLVFTAPLPIAANFKLNSANGEAIIDPNLKTPYYQQFNLGIERQVKRTVFAVRYVGNHGTRLLQSIDENQINLNAGGFLSDFINAQNNGFLAQAAGLGFQPAYNPAVAGSKPLPVFAELPSGGRLTGATVINDIQSGQAASLAQLYQQTGTNGPINFFPNPNEQVGRVLTNYANSTFNSLQTEARGKLTKDLQFQFSYVYGKVMTDSAATPQTGNILDLIDLNNGGIARGRASFDVTHVFKANYIYQVPLGAGHRFLSGRFMDRIFGGWATSAIITHQSGNTFGVTDPIGTLNLASIATYAQGAVINGTTKSQLDAAVGNRTYVNGNGVYFVSPSIISAAGQGVAPFGSPAYQGADLLQSWPWPDWKPANR